MSLPRCGIFTTCCEIITPIKSNPSIRSCLTSLCDSLAATSSSCTALLRLCSGGGVGYYPRATEDRYLLTRTELLERLDVLLGGRTAEEIVFGEVSTGAQDDLQRATDLARHMIMRYGMSATLGLATFEAPRQAPFMQGPTGAPQEYSEETARVIDAEIYQLLEASHARVRETLLAKRVLLKALATLPIQHEVVDRNALDGLLATPVSEEAASALVPG